MQEKHHSHCQVQMHHYRHHKSRSNPVDHIANKLNLIQQKQETGNGFAALPSENQIFHSKPMPKNINTFLQPFLCPTNVKKMAAIENQL